MTIRVATFNVHDARGRRLEPVAAAVRESGADVVALQECGRHFVDWLAWSLGKDPGGEDWHVAWAPADYCGNGLVSRLPIDDSRSLVIRVPEVREGRSAVDAWLRGPSGDPLRVCATHLDQLTEAGRLAQWAALEAQLLGRAPLDGFDGLVCADLNALNRRDHDADSWRRLGVARSRTRWEPPQSELIAGLLGAGYRDALAETDAQTPGSVTGTCRFDTRIDYLLAGPAFPGWFVRGSYRQLPARDRGVSDHDLVSAAVHLPR